MRNTSRNRGMSESDKPTSRGLTRREWMLVLILAISADLFRVAVSIFPERPARDKGNPRPLSTFEAESRL
jgi:hypothetical protein